MLAERPRDGAERIPDTLQALIGARIDRLPGAERVLLQRAAAMGRIFMAGALEELSPELDDVERRARRPAPARPHRPRAADDDQRRAGLQVPPRPHPRGRVLRAVEELAGRAAPRVRGLAQGARRRRARRDPRVPPRPGRAAPRGARRLRAARPAPRRLRPRSTHAGRRALSREAFRSARKLLLRAAELSPTLERRYLAGRAAWRLGDMTAVIVEMEEVASVAAAHGERPPAGPRAHRARRGRPEPARRRDHGAAARRAGDRGPRGRAAGHPLRGVPRRHGRRLVARRRRGVRALGEARARGVARRRAEGPGGGDHERARARVPPPARARRGGAAHRPRRRARRAQRQRPRPRAGAARARLARELARATPPRRTRRSPRRVSSTARSATRRARRR